MTGFQKCKDWRMSSQAMGLERHLACEIEHPSVAAFQARFCFIYIKQR
jgi:hypothetical protein